MTDPGVDQFLVNDFRLIHALRAGLVVFKGVEFLCPVSASYKMDHRFITFVSQLHSVQASLVKNCLPDILVVESGSIHDASVTDYNSLLIGIKCYLQEEVLERHLRSHDIKLSLDSFRKPRLVSLNKGATLHEHGSSLRYDQNSKTHFDKLFVESSQRSSFTRARPSGDTDPVDWVLALLHDLWVVEIMVVSSLTFLVALTDESPLLTWLRLRNFAVSRRVWLSVGSASRRAFIKIIDDIFKALDIVLWRSCLLYTSRAHET